MLIRQCRLMLVCCGWCVDVTGLSSEANQCRDIPVSAPPPYKLIKMCGGVNRQERNKIEDIGRMRATHIAKHRNLVALIIP
jgi:hypothetical protein